MENYAMSLDWMTQHCQNDYTIQGNLQIQFNPYHVPNGSFLFFYFFFVFLGQHMEVPRLGVKLELQLPAYATAIAMADVSHVCDLHNSSQQCWILNPPSKARDRTRILMDPGRVH